MGTNNMLHRRFSQTACLLLGLGLAVTGCNQPGPGRFKLSEDVQRPPANLVIFFADGMDVQRLREMLDSGLLPNIRHTFLEGGVQVRDGISSMPSVTYPNCSAIVTGRYPGHHGIMGNFWFERGRLLIRYYMTLATARDVNAHLESPTVYDMLADRLTVSVLAQTHKGVTVSYDMKNVFDWNWIMGTYTAVDTSVGESITDVFALANRVRQWPTVLLMYHPGVDETGHRQGTDSMAYAAALENIDRNVGLVTDAIETAGLTGSTYFVLIADHGMVPIRNGQDFALIDWLRKVRKLKVLNSPLDDPDFADRYDEIQDYDVVATVDAGRVAMIHLHGNRGWLNRPTPEEVQAWAHVEPALHELPAVHLVAVRGGENRAVAWSREGSVTVERQLLNGHKRYRIAEYTGDPLGYMRSPELVQFFKAGWHDSREWLAATASSRNPDFVAQVVEMFDSPRTGDVVVFAAPDWLLYPNEQAGHGSTLYRDMHVPMFFTGPGLPPGGQVDRARIVDLVPTFLGLLGEAHRLEDFPQVDGIDLSDELRTARVPEEVLPPPTPRRPVPQSTP